jgi:hypothetical protein
LADFGRSLGEKRRQHCGQLDVASGDEGGRDAESHGGGFAAAINTTRVFLAPKLKVVATGANLACHCADIQVQGDGSCPESSRDRQGLVGSNDVELYRTIGDAAGDLIRVQPELEVLGSEAAA